MGKGINLPVNIEELRVIRDEAAKHPGDYVWRCILKSATKKVAWFEGDDERATPAPGVAKETP